MPPCAASSQPLRGRGLASTPKSSASAVLSEKAPQFSATKGPARPLAWWTWRAMSSLPVPAAPTISAGAPEGAIRASVSSTTRELWSSNTRRRAPGSTVDGSRPRAATAGVSRWGARAFVDPLAMLGAAPGARERRMAQLDMRVPRRAGWPDSSEARVDFQHRARRLRAPALARRRRAVPGRDATAGTYAGRVAWKVHPCRPSHQPRHPRP